MSPFATLANVLHSAPTSVVAFAASGGIATVSMFAVSRHLKRMRAQVLTEVIEQGVEICGRFFFFGFVLLVFFVAALL
jgi:hypothetical protein